MSTLQICLVSIVKNESHIIIRMLDSAKPVIDFFCICDTGSTDGTVDLIRNWGKENNIPGVVIQHPWKDFGYNRSLSITEAKKACSCDYLLFLDADMVLNVTPTFDKSSLKDDCYMVEQRKPRLVYSNIRLVKSSLSWVCKGKTHEYYHADDCQGKTALKSLFITDLDDGGSKEDKSERDIQLLKEDINESGTERSIFYLANTYRDIKDYQKAIKYYQIRLELGGYRQEIWYSMYRIGTCSEMMDNYPEAVFWYLEAYNYLPSRAEPIHSLTRMYRIQGKYQLAYDFAHLGMTIPQPKDNLFVEYAVYNGLFDYELGIVCYYLKKMEEGKAACLRVDSSPIFSEAELARNKKNLAFYEEISQ
jgi:glycosyltransferase involved in cell wall biosynthesis